VTGTGKLFLDRTTHARPWAICVWQADKSVDWTALSYHRKTNHIYSSENTQHEFDAANEDQTCSDDDCRFAMSKSVIKCACMAVALPLC
jgi:hypothetical protein